MMTRAFLPPPPLLSPQPAKARIRQTPKSAWEDTLLPQTPRSAPTPSTHSSLHLLSLSGPLAYATAEPLGKPRSSYPKNSSALPLPFERPERGVIQDAFTHLHGTKFPPSYSSTHLPAGLLDTLGVSRADCINGGNRALAVLQTVLACGAELLSVYVEEAPSTGFEIRAVLTIRIPVGSVCGELVYKERSVCVGPAFGVAVGNVSGVDVMVERLLYEEASITVENMLQVYETPGAVAVVEKVFKGEAVMEDFVVPWEMRANEVDTLNDCVLRQSLRKCGIGVTRREDRASLLRKFVNLMDEVERREYGIMLAAQEGLYGLAGELQRGRSERGRLLEEMTLAERRGNWSKVVELGMKLRRLDECIMDISAEPGTYSRDLDRDEWYRPNR